MRATQALTSPRASTMCANESVMRFRLDRPAREIEKDGEANQVKVFV